MHSAAGSEFPFKTDIAFQAGDIVFAVDRRGRIVYWNDDAAKAFGYPRDQAHGIPLEVICRATGGSPVNLPAILAGHDFAGGMRCHHEDGRDIALYMYATAARDDAGHAEGAIFVARDVTDFWRAEEAIRSSEDKYRVLFEGSSDAVMLATVDGRVLEANPAASRVFGYPPEELKRRTLLDLIRPEKRREADADLARLTRDGSLSAVLEAVTKQGQPITIEMSATAVTVQGEARICSIIRDVTARAKAEHAVRDSEERYRTIFESASDAVFLETLDGRLLDVNDNACRLLGYERTELLSKRVADLVPADSRAWLPRLNDTLLKTGRFRTESVYLRSDGTQVPVEVTASVTMLGEAPLIVAMTRDISERVAAEAALRASELRYRTLAETSPDAVAMIDARGRITYASPRLAQLHGYAGPAEMVGVRILETIIPADRERAVATGRITYKKGYARDVQLTFVRRDGTTFEGELNTAVVRAADGAPAGLIGVSRDITARRAAERELTASEERYRTVFETTGSATIIIEEDTTISLANREFFRLFGYGPEHVVGHSWTGFVHPDDLARMKKFHDLRRADPDAAPRDYEFRMMDSQGNVRDCSLTIDVIPGTKRSVASISDITERRRNEAALVASEERYRRMFNDSPLGIYRTTPDGRILMANPAIMQMLGYSSYRELVAVNVEKAGFGPRYPRSEFKKRLERDAEVRGLEAEWVRPDGRVIHVRESARVVRDPTGKVLYYEGVVEDITARRAAEQAVRENEAGFRALAENANDGIGVYDEGGNLTYVNSRAAQMCGCRVEDMVGRSFADHLRPQDREALRERARKRLAGEEVPAHYLVSVLMPDRSEVEVELSVARTTWHGRAAGIAVIRDLTERRQAERALRESEARYRTSIDAMTDALHVVDRELRLIIVNASFRQWMQRLGLPGELAGRNLREAFPFLHAGVEDEYRYIFETGQQLSSEELTVVAGREIATETRKVPVVEDGKTVRVLTIVRDVTARKQAEKRLQESEDQFRRLVDLSPDGVAVHQDGRIVLVNQAGAAVLGYDTPAEVIGLPVLGFVHPDDREKVVARIQRVLEQGRPGELVEERFRRRDGGYVPVEVVNAPFTWRGRPAVQVVVRDMTERRKLSRALEETAAQMNGILENSPDAIVAECDGRIAYANWRFVRMFGYDAPSQVVGRPSGEFDAPDSREQLAEYGRLRLEGKPAPERYQFRGLRRDGILLDLETSISSYQFQGRTYILAFIRERATGR